MDKEKINLEFIEISKKTITAGDIFVIKPPQMPFYYGIVANANAKMFGAEKILHVQFFDLSTKKFNLIPDKLCESSLLIPPILTNRIAWSRGYFKTIGNMSIEKFNTIRKSSFYYFNGEIFDDESNQLSQPYSLETTGSFSITSYLNIDNLISLKLGIPLAVTPPENWNPYWYQKELYEKYNLQ